MIIGEMTYFTHQYFENLLRDRFPSLHRFLHFVDNNNPIENDRLWKVRKVFTMIVEKY